jgi:hypothetical protein
MIGFRSVKKLRLSAVYIPAATAPLRYCDVEVFKRAFEPLDGMSANDVVRELFMRPAFLQRWSGMIGTRRQSEYPSPLHVIVQRYGSGP